MGLLQGKGLFQYDCEHSVVFRSVYFGHQVNWVARIKVIAHVTRKQVFLDLCYSLVWPQ